MERGFEHIALQGDQVKRIVACRRTRFISSLRLVDHVLAQVARGEQPKTSLVIAARDAIAELQVSIE